MTFGSAVHVGSLLFTFAATPRTPLRFFTLILPLYLYYTCARCCLYRTLRDVTWTPIRAVHLLYSYRMTFLFLPGQRCLCYILLRIPAAHATATPTAHGSCTFPHRCARHTRWFAFWRFGSCHLDTIRSSAAHLHTHYTITWTTHCCSYIACLVTHSHFGRRCTARFTRTFLVAWLVGLPVVRRFTGSGTIYHLPTVVTPVLHHIATG